MPCPQFNSYHNDQNLQVCSRVFCICNMSRKSSAMILCAVPCSTSIKQASNCIHSLATSCDLSIILIPFICGNNSRKKSMSFLKPQDKECEPNFGVSHIQSNMWFTNSLTEGETFATNCKEPMMLCISNLVACVRFRQE